MDCPVFTGLRQARWFAFEPTTETRVAALSALVWIGGYYLLTHVDAPPWSTAYFFAALTAVVVLPVWWFCWHRKHPLYEVGITSRYWKESLLVSVIVGLPFVWLVLVQYGGGGVTALLPQFVFNAMTLWEPFFVFCWLELRFGKAFGIIPGIVLAGACFGAYHLGTYPLAGAFGLALYGMVFAAIFRLTDSILTMWPLAWAGSSTKGTLAGGMVFTWPEVGFMAVILLVQLAFLLATVRLDRRRRRGPAGPRSG